VGEILIPGDPGGLSGLASQLGAAAGEIGAVQGRVAANGLGGSWSGTAAEAFRSSLDELPGELAKVAHAFGDAGHAISAFAARLADLQQRARWYNQQLESARNDLAAAEARRGSAQMELRAAQQRQRAAHDPASLHAAQSAVGLGETRLGQAVAQVDDASARISRLESAGATLRDEYDQAVRACCAALDSARHSGSHSLLGWVGNQVKGMGEFVEGGVATLWHGAANLAEDAEEGAEHLVDAGLRELDEHWGEWRHALLVADDWIGSATFSIGLGLAVAGGAVLVFAPGPAKAAALPFLALDEDVIAVGSTLQKIDEGLIFAGDGAEARRGKRRYQDELDNDLVRLGDSAIGGKVVGSALGKVKPIRAAGSKLVSRAKRDLDPKAAKAIGKDLKDVGKNIKDLVGGKISDGAVDDAPRALITAPLEVPTPFTIKLPVPGAIAR
jgi:uncharacterized protein YukE